MRVAAGGSVPWGSCGPWCVRARKVVGLCWMLVKVKVVEVKKAWVKAPRDKRRVVAVVGCNWLAAPTAKKLDGAIDVSGCRLPSTVIKSKSSRQTPCWTASCRSPHLAISWLHPSCASLKTDDTPTAASGPQKQMLSSAVLRGTRQHYFFIVVRKGGVTGAVLSRSLPFHLSL